MEVRLRLMSIRINKSFDGSTDTPWECLLRVFTGGIIINTLGLVLGYYATVLTIEILGRIFIQIMGFLLTALLLGMLKRNNLLILVQHPLQPSRHFNKFLAIHNVPHYTSSLHSRTSR
jgi:hypothetical protein